MSLKPELIFHLKQTRRWGITELSNLNANHKTHKKASPLANKVFLIIALLLTVVVIVMVFLLLRPE